MVNLASPLADTPGEVGGGARAPRGLEAAQVMDRFMVGRQPILDAGLNVLGYELLFRDPAYQLCGDAKTADVLVHTCMDLGLKSLVGDKLAFVNTTRAYLVGEYDIPFPPRQTVIDILEDVPRDADVVAGCRRLVQNGYTLAADGRFAGDHDPLLDLVSMIKVDVCQLPPTELPSAVLYASAYGVKLVAKKVENREQFLACQNYGFDYFQGYFLARPDVIEGRSLSPSRLACLRVMERLCDPDTSPEEIEQIVKADPGLCHRFLRVAGTGAAKGLHRRLSSVREGVVLLGQRKLRAWVSLMLLAEHDHQGSQEQLAMAMTRAKMAELVAAKVEPGLSEQAFTAGLVSSLDTLLGTPLEQLVKELALTAEVEDAVVNRAGPLGQILDDVIALQVGEDRPVRSGLHLAAMSEAYVESLAWATRACEALTIA